MILGLDIGGANTKAASSDGSFAESIYLPLWNGAPLGEALQWFANLKPDAAAVVMTGELADCFQNKIIGINSIKEAVENAFECPKHFWGISGFDPVEPLDMAGANWSASANLISHDVSDCLFVDMGSTTMDLIPIRDKPIAAATDYLRLAKGELVYIGLLRTSLNALLPKARIRGNVVPLSPELFAVMADAYIALGDISPEDYTCDTPDGANKDRTYALRRLARCVCADLEEIGEEGAIAIAEQARDRMFRLIVASIQQQAQRHGLTTVVAAGIGEGVIARAAGFLGIRYLGISEKYGKKISNVFPAYAVARLLEIAGHY